ncbi:hypothetical protein OPIT5_09885 [Opitutaceae bacterium TAV5]|nr:hypothetical protein OPIT5_09885 [Opitutaceae bacterium TAV5]
MRASPAIACFTLLLASAVAGEPLRRAGPVLTLDNGCITLEVAPDAGRVTRFARHGEPDRIAFDDRAVPSGTDWKPWGGDRIWPMFLQLSPQIYGAHNFDPAFDDQPWAVMEHNPAATLASPARLTLRSRDSRHLALRIIRTITLEAGRAEVLHTVRFECLADSPYPVHVWAVTAVRAGDYVLMEHDRRVRPAAEGESFKWWPALSPVRPAAFPLPGAAAPRALHVPWPAAASAAAPLKVGTWGRWIALVSGGSAFVQTVRYDPAALYLDESNLQTWLEPGRAIYEIETLGPTWFLRAGESREWTVRWRLVDFPPSLHTPAERAGWLAETLTP